MLREFGGLCLYLLLPGVFMACEFVDLLGTYSSTNHFPFENLMV